jgi:hypothetical protein
MTKKKVKVIPDNPKQYYSIAKQLVDQINLRDKKIKELEDEQDS